MKDLHSSSARFVSFGRTDLPARAKGILVKRGFGTGHVPRTSS